MSHVAVTRRPGDTFAGMCPFHGDCLEGMASGPAIGARFGRRAEELEGADREDAAEIAAFYLATALRGIVYTLAPERIVLGGGVSQLPGLVARTRRAFASVTPDCRLSAQSVTARARPPTAPRS